MRRAREATGSIDFLIDPATAPGLAHIELSRSGGGAAELTGRIPVAAVAPGLFTTTMNTRGPAVGVARQQDGSVSPLAACGEQLPDGWTPNCISMGPGSGMLSS